ncbi:MAG: GNAT family N-acetyltransferase [Terriglobales bacterium]
MVSIRPPRPGDEDRIAELAGQLGYPSSGPQVRQRLQDLTSRAQACVRVAELDGELSGWIAASVMHCLECVPIPEITGLVVDERRRSSGIGAALLTAVEAWARASGYGALTVRSNIVRVRAHRFYLRHGYTVVKTQRCFQRELR